MSNHETPFVTVSEAPIDEAQVLVRADFNVPMQDGEITDDDRIQAALPTLQHLLERDVSVVVCAHLGNPKQGYESGLSLRPVANRLATLLDRDVEFAPDVVGAEVRSSAQQLTRGSVMLLENLRFNTGEKANDPDFARALAVDSAAAFFVQDGFGVTHREHASTSAITQFVPAISGLALAEEYVQITSAIESPERPLTVLAGGSKVSDKVPLIERYIALADRIIIGGAMANTFLRYRHGYDLGQSRVEDDIESLLASIYAQATAKVGAEAVDDFLLLPQDLAYEGVDGIREECPASDVPRHAAAFDIGSLSIERAIKSLGDQGTVIFNGPLGFFEKPAFSDGSVMVARHIAESGLTSIVGGGDTGAMVRSAPGLANGFSHVSRGGGACLQLMTGERMPGIDALVHCS